MASVAALLDSPRAVRSPILHDKAVKLLLAMLGPQLDVARRTAGGGLGRTAMMPGEGLGLRGEAGLGMVQRAGQDRDAARWAGGNVVAVMRQGCCEAGGPQEGGDLLGTV